MKLIASLFLVLFAVVGAFATAKNTALAPVFYYDISGNCQQGDATPCEFEGIENCEELVDVEGGGTVFAQIYQDRIAPNLCDVPYSRTQP